MRKIIYMILAVLLAVSCENTVEKIWSDENEAILVVNAQMLQDNHNHRVFVNCSEGGSTTKILDAAVTCAINGGAAVQALPVIVEKELYNGNIAEEFYGYGFDADLNPGDEIAINVRWKDLSASAKVKVPESAATITALDTMKVVLTGENSNTGGNTRTTRQYNITVKDFPGEKNYYMLRAEEIFYRIDASGRKVASISCNGQFDADYDRILHPLESSLMDDIIGSDNRYEIFNDEMFADASCTLKIMDAYYYYYLDDVFRFFEQFEEGDSYAMDRIFKVYTISFEEYLYLKALGSNELDLEFMTEPVIYPENVTGGLGFVTVVTPSTWTISFPPEPYTGEPPIDAYRYRDPIAERPDDYYY